MQHLCNNAHTATFRILHRKSNDLILATRQYRNNNVWSLQMIDFNSLRTITMITAVCDIKRNNMGNIWYLEHGQRSRHYNILRYTSMICDTEKLDCVSSIISTRVLYSYIQYMCIFKKIFNSSGNKSCFFHILNSFNIIYWAYAY